MIPIDFGVSRSKIPTRGALVKYFLAFKCNGKETQLYTKSIHNSGSMKLRKPDVT